MAAWDIVSIIETSKFIRIPRVDTDDSWYLMAQGLIEAHTGWSLDAQASITEYVDGTGATYIIPSQIPISSVASVKLEGSTVPSTHYQVKWNMIDLKTYRNNDLYIYDNIYSVEQFYYGSGNVEVTYDCGGYASLPSKYFQSVRTCFLFLIKELSEFYRGEGSDQMLRSYRPDRTQNPEEVLRNYGVHGKMMDGILYAFLPEGKIYA